MTGSIKSNVYLTVTTEQGKQQHGLSHVWLISVEPHKHALLGLGHKNGEPVHYSASHDAGSGGYSIKSHPLASEPDLSGNILVAEDVKASPEEILQVLEKDLQTPDQGQKEVSDHWVRRAIASLQSSGHLPSFSVDDLMTFANGYASNREARKAPALVPYPKSFDKPEKKVQKQGFWVTHPMESSVKHEDNIEGDPNVYGGLM